MEFDVPSNLNDFSHDHAESIWNAPFSGLGRRIIKSHVFCYRQNIDYLRKNWPSSPIVLVNRSDDSCLGWWVRSGGFSITYPDYVPYYVDLATMASRITEQNKGLLSAWHDYDGQQPETNRQLAELLGLEPPPLIYAQNYAVNDIQVKVI